MRVTTMTTTPRRGRGLATTIAMAMLSLMVYPVALPAALRVALLLEQQQQQQQQQAAGSNDLSIILSLAEADLATHADEVSLLERQAIDKVLAEQQLAGTIGNAEQAVRLGAILSADLLAFVQPDRDKPADERLGLVVFDARSGVRLIDAALVPVNDATPQPGPERQAQRLANLVLRAAGKAAKLRDPAKADGPAASLLAISFLPARNVDLPESETARCQAIVHLIERQLTNRADVVVLERARLSSVTRERELSGETPSSTPAGAGNEPAIPQGLQSSLVRAQLDVARAPNSPATGAILLQLQLTVTDARGQKVASATASGTADSLATLASTLSAALLEQLGRAKPDDHAPAAAEAAVLIREAEFLWRHELNQQALSVAEAAYALNPDDSLSIAVRARGQISAAATTRLVPTQYNTIFDLPDGAGQLKQVLRETDAAMPALRVAAERRAREGGWSGDSERHYHEALVRVGDLLARVYRHIVHVDTTGQQPKRFPIDDESLASFRSIQRQFKHVRVTIDHPLDLARVRDAESFAMFSYRLSVTLRDLKRSTAHSKSSDSVQTLGGLLNEWTDRFFLYEPETISINSNNLILHIKELGRAAFATAPYSATWTDGMLPPATPDEAELRMFRTILQRLSEHPDANLKSSAKDIIQPIERVLNGQSPYVYRKRSKPAANAKIVRLNAAPTIVTPAIRPAMGGTANYWEHLVELADFYRPPERRGSLRSPTIHGDSVYALTYNRLPAGGTAMQLIRYPLSGDPPTPLGQRELAATDRDPFRESVVDPGHPFLRDFYPRIDPICLTDGTYYWIHDHDSVTLFPLNGDAPFDLIVEDLGIPDLRVDECAVLNGNLYVASSGLLIRYNLKTKKSQTLVSTRRAEKQSPLDNCPPFMMRSLFVDAPRRRLLFTVSTTSVPLDLCGIWSYTPATGKLERLMSDLREPADVPPAARETPIVVRPLPGNRLFFANVDNFAQATLDLTTGKHTVINERKKPWPGEQGETLWFADEGWMWRGWARYPASGGEIQQFPEVRNVTFAGRWPPFVSPIDGKRVLVADAMGMWVVVPPKPGTPPPPPYVPPLNDAPAGGGLPYTRTRTLYDLAQTRDADYIVRPIVHDGGLYAVALLPDGSRQLRRFSLSDGPYTDLGTMKGDRSWIAPEHGFKIGTTGFATGACIVGQAYYLATDAGSLIEFPLDGSAPQQAREVSHGGTPSVVRLAAVDGKVVALANRTDPDAADPNGIFLTVYDPTTRSSRLVQCTDEQRVPLQCDGGFNVVGIFADPSDQRLLVVVEPEDRHAPRTLAGWWSCDLATGVSRQLVPWTTELRYWAVGLRMMPDGNYWLWAGNQIAMLDPRSGSYRILARGDGAEDETADGLIVSEQERAFASVLLQRAAPPPVVFDGDWAWGLFQRTKRDGSLIERFPDPRSAPGGRSIHTEFLQLIDDGKRLVAADQSGCWIFELQQ